MFDLVRACHPSFTLKHSYGRQLPVAPPILPGIERVNELTVLGVILQNDLRMDKQVSNSIARANSDLFALKTLRSHGLSSEALSQVCRMTLVSKLAYASPAWKGFCSVDELSRLGAVERKARRWGFCDCQESLSDILDNADKDL